MPDDAHLDAAPRQHSPRPSRRAFLIGAASLAAAAAIGVPAAMAVGGTPTTNGRLVSPMLRVRPFTIAHHGGSRDWPEMSMFAYRSAAAAGVDALEMSVARTSDGVWFGLHDSTLDRTSGTTNFIPAQHTWAEVKQYLISAAGTTSPSQQARPYARVEEVLTAFGDTHTIFLDPKTASATYYPELLSIVERLVSDPQQTVVAKGYCTTTGWGLIAQKRGYQSWGYYYANELAASSTLLTSTLAAWTLLGLDAGGDAAQWASLVAVGRPVIGHVVQTAASAQTSLAKGAQGLMISGVAETMPYVKTIQ